MTYEKKLEELNIILPKSPIPIANFIPCKKVGKIIYLSGQGPFENGKQKYKGKLGLDYGTDEGYLAAKLSCLNLLSVLKHEIKDLDLVDEVVRVFGLVNCSPDFSEHPKVINGASDLLVEIFGERGKHSRLAVGVNSLPSNIPVEIEMIVKMK